MNEDEIIVSIGDQSNAPFPRRDARIQAGGLVIEVGQTVKLSRGFSWKLSEINFPSWYLQATDARIFARLLAKAIEIAEQWDKERAGKPYEGD